MLTDMIGRLRSVPVPPEIEVTPDHVKERVAAERAETRRELASLQVRALRLATEERLARGEGLE